MEKSIQDQIRELMDEIEECQKTIRDETLDKVTRDEARGKIQEDWFQISHLRKMLKQEGADTDGD